MAKVIDEQRFPLAAQAIGDLFDTGSDAGFEDGLQVILAGLRARHLNQDSPPPLGVGTP